MSATAMPIDGLDDVKMDTAMSSAKTSSSGASSGAASSSAASGASSTDVKGSKMADIKGLDDDVNGHLPLKLISNDKKEFLVERKHAFISTLVKTSLENDDKAKDLPIPGVTGSILELIVNYMKEHKGVEPPIIEKPLRSKVMKDVCPHKWDAEYIDKTGEIRQQLYDLILAANYMDIKSLLHLGCAKVASLIKGQSLEKIKEILDPNPKDEKTTSTSSGSSSKDEKTTSTSSKDEKTSTTSSTTTSSTTAAAGTGAASASSLNAKVKK